MTKKTFLDLLQTAQKDTRYLSWNQLFLHKDSYDLTGSKKIKIAVLSSFTITNLKNYFHIQCLTENVLPDIYWGPYNQYSQECLNTHSELYTFSPELVFLFFNAHALFGDAVYATPDGRLRRDLVQLKIKELTDALSVLTKNLPAKIIINNSPASLHAPAGIADCKLEYGLQEMIEDWNRQLHSICKNTPSVFMFDLQQIILHFSGHITNEKMKYLGDIQWADTFIPKVSQKMVAYVRAVKGLNKKCLVLDLDNTLWGGILGEDGESGIKLGGMAPGNIYKELQKYILALHTNGVILAINSKNNEEDVFHVIDHHPEMVLRREHFAAMRINWQDKVSNMKELAKAINIGLDSMVFLDDDIVNRIMMKELLPQVLTLDFPEDIATLPELVASLDVFDRLAITTEDIHRGEMYQAQKKRETLQQQTEHIDDFLKNLKTEITVALLNTYTLSRIAQLTQKTNQFNFRTQRYTEEQITQFTREGGLVYGVHVKDTFGDSGLVGVVMLKKDKGSLFLENFLLSCRVLGRDIEKAILGYIIQTAKKAGDKHVIGEYIQTDKNEQVKDFYAMNGFEQKDGKWYYDLSKAYIIPTWVNNIKVG